MRNNEVAQGPIMRLFQVQAKKGCAENKAADETKVTGMNYTENLMQYFLAEGAFHEHGIYFGSESREIWVARFPGFGAVFDSGIRSMLAVPLWFNSLAAASLVLASTDPRAYDDQSLVAVNEVGAAVVERVMELAPGQDA